MTTKDRRATQPGSKLRELRTMLVLAVAMLIASTGIIVRAAGARRGFDDKGGFQGHENNGRNDDWDDNDRDHHRESYAIGLWGDLPYSDVQADPGVPNLIADMNSQKLAFTAHDGDLKAGSGTAGSTTPTTCANDKYVQAVGFLEALAMKAPAVFTPGDNDWTDCDNAANGNFNSLERLDHERQVFFSTDHTLGLHQLHQAVQTDTLTTPCKGFKTGSGTITPNAPTGIDPGTYNIVACVENRRWTYRGVTYVTLDIQGSCDNLCKDHPDPTEHSFRKTADIAWMREAFNVAKQRNSAAVMIISQADPGFDLTDGTRGPLRNPKTLAETDAFSGPLDGYQEFLVALRDEVKAFQKPVAYVHGDSHYFRIDKPFYDSDPPDSVNTGARRLENFTRVETFGDNVLTKDAAHPDQGDLNNVHWVKVFVDPDSREVFSYQIQIVPANRVVVPAP